MSGALVAFHCAKLSLTTERTASFEGQSMPGSLCRSRLQEDGLGQWHCWEEDSTPRGSVKQGRS